MRLISLLLLMLLTGCVVVPQEVRTNQDVGLATYGDVIAGNVALGAPVRWGGVIANIENVENGTKVEVVHFPLKSNARPNVNQASLGRFIVYTPAFLDPLVYQVNRAVTFVGMLGEAEQGMIGEHRYDYPVINAGAYYMWPEIKEVDTRIIVTPYYRFHSYYGYFNGPAFYPSYWHHYYVPTYKRVSPRRTNYYVPSTKHSSSSTKHHQPNKHNDRRQHDQTDFKRNQQGDVISRKGGAIKQTEQGQKGQSYAHNKHAEQTDSGRQQSDARRQSDSRQQQGVKRAPHKPQRRAERTHRDQRDAR